MTAETLETARKMQDSVNAASRLVVPTATSAVEVAPEFLAKMTALRQTIAPDLTDPELELFALIAQRRGLDPFSGQINAVKRQTKRGPRVSFQTGIDGHRSIAERTGQYRGSDEAEFGDECGCGKAPAHHPAWARVVVHRRIAEGDYIHQPGRAKWDEYVPSDSFIWTDKPEIMLSKCAEAQALRKAFPWVLGDLYIPEEMARSIEDDGPAPKIVSARESVAAKAAALRGETTTVNTGDTGTNVIITEVVGGTDVSGDDPTSNSAVPRQPKPDAGGPGVENAAPMSAQEFLVEMAARKITQGSIRAVAADMFGDRPASELTPVEWGALHARLTS